MRIYVASRFAAYERVRAFIDVITAAGHQVTQDWTRTDEFGPDGHPLLNDEAALLPGVAGRHDLRGVRTADLVVFLADEGGFCGALIEVGAACAWNVPVWLVAPWRPSIFWHLPNVTLISDETAALDALTGAEMVA